MILPPPKPSCPAPPPDPFAREVLARLPLAESFYTVWGYLATESVLAALFDPHRGRCYQDQLTFPVSEVGAKLVTEVGDSLRTVLRPLPLWRNSPETDPRTLLLTNPGM
jgi:hypothetical protein